MPLTLKQLCKGGIYDRASRPQQTTIFHNLQDGLLYRIYLASPMMYTGSWLVAERLFYSNGGTKKIPKSRLKDYVVVGYR